MCVDVGVIDVKGTRRMDMSTLWTWTMSAIMHGHGMVLDDARA